MTARAVLDGIKDRLYATTTGPWQHQPYGGQNQNGDYSGGYVLDGHGEYLISDVSDRDGPFIAAAPTTVARLVEAVEGVLALHIPDTYGECRRCHGGNGFYHAYPCPTVAAIENALTKEGQ